MQTKNVKQGLITRTKIVSTIEGGLLTTHEVCERSGVRYSSVLHHLHLMEDESIVDKEEKRPYLWRLTGTGQKRLTDK